MNLTTSALEKARTYPYDGQVDGDWAMLAARAVLADLSDRRGIKWALAHADDDDDDHETSREIVETLAAVIRAAHETVMEHQP